MGSRIARPLRFRTYRLPSTPSPNETPQHDAEACPFCRAEKKKQLASTALVQVVDAEGQVPAVDARKLLGLEEGQTIVVRGEAQIDGLGNLAVRAAGVYVRPPPEKRVVTRPPESLGHAVGAGS